MNSIILFSLTRVVWQRAESIQHRHVYPSISLISGTGKNGTTDLSNTAAEWDVAKQCEGRC